MEDRHGRVNLRLDDLEPAERDQVKQAIRKITAHSLKTTVKDLVPEQGSRRRVS